MNVIEREAGAGGGSVEHPQTLGYHLLANADAGNDRYRIGAPVHMQRPPSSSRHAPVIRSDSGEARNVTALAMSRGWLNRPSEIVATMWSCTFLRENATKGSRRQIKAQAIFSTLRLES
jgi:hypothetical protein